MKTVTLTIDEETFSRAEQKAASLQTSVSKVVAEYLQKWAVGSAIDQARTAMSNRFANPDWQFAVGAADNREQRNARR
jgi:hypothetical protein